MNRRTYQRLGARSRNSWSELTALWKGILTVGEAKRRKASPPSTVERTSRWFNRLINLYPRPLRVYVRFNLQLMFWMLVLFAGLVLIAVVSSHLRAR